VACDIRGNIFQRSDLFTDAFQIILKSTTVCQRQGGHCCITQRELPHKIYTYIYIPSGIIGALLARSAVLSSGESAGLQDMHGTETYTACFMADIAVKSGPRPIGGFGTELLSKHCRIGNRSGIRGRLPSCCLPIHIRKVCFFDQRTYGCVIGNSSLSQQTARETLSFTVSLIMGLNFSHLTASL